MSKSQIEHLKSRMSDAINTAVEKFRTGLPKLPKALTVEQMTAQLRSGKAKLKAGVDADTYGSMKRHFIFDDGGYVVAKEKQSELVSKFEASLRKKQQHIMDVAILGDAENALSELDKFIASVAK